MQEKARPVPAGDWFYCERPILRKRPSDMIVNHLLDSLHSIRAIMRPAFASLGMWLLAARPALAQGADTPHKPAAWAIILFCLILGLIVTLRPAGRIIDFKRSKDD
jgi:hypothetical protein